MIRFKHIIFTLATAALFTLGCEKKVAPIDSFGVSVNFNTGNPKNLTGNISINPKDSVILDFTIASSIEEMAVIEIQKNGARIDTFNVSGSNKMIFSGIKRYMSDSIAGDYTYRIFARNKKGIYIGDGGKIHQGDHQSRFYLLVKQILGCARLCCQNEQIIFCFNQW